MNMTKWVKCLFLSATLAGAVAHQTLVQAACSSDIQYTWADNASCSFAAGKYVYTAGQTSPYRRLGVVCTGNDCNISQAQQGIAFGQGYTSAGVAVGGCFATTRGGTAYSDPGDCGASATAHQALWDEFVIP